MRNESFQPSAVIIDISGKKREALPKIIIRKITQKINFTAPLLHPLVFQINE